MASVTFSQILSNVHLALGQPPQEHLTMREMFYALRKVAAKYFESVRQSDQNRQISFEEFTLATDEREYDLSAVIGRGTPAWVERRTTEDTSQDDWEVIQVVNLHSLESARNEGREACAFYGNEDGDTYIKFTFDSTREHRVYYDAEDVFSPTLSTVSTFPENFNTLLELDAVSFCIPLLINGITRRSEMHGGPGISETRLRALEMLSERIDRELAEWRKKYDIWLHRSPGAQSARNRPRRFNRRLY